ncbi:nacht and ankyrin containing protein, partial [Fusarium langsethiae]
MAERSWDSTFQRDGDGSQFNAIGGGTQNNNIGGYQFPRAVFHGNVNFVKGSGSEHSQQQLCLQSLSFPEMESRSKDVDTATPGTCKWLLGHGKYKSWEQNNRGLLWIKGKPGSGKSTLLRHALNRIQADKGRDNAVVLSFFFHGRGVKLQRTPLGLFRSLLHQLLSRVPDALLKLIATFEERCKNMGEAGEKWQWHLNELRDFFRSSLPKVLETRPIWLFVDALDECGEKNAVDLVEEFKTLLEGLSGTGSDARICFTCRHYPIGNLNYGLDICLEDENGQDISTYVQVRLEPSIPATIQKMITDRASGVFMWARLVLDRVLALERKKLGWKKIKDEIDKIPPDLDDLYRELIQRMDDKETSLKLIRWICFATRPLSPGELRWAMILDAKIVDDNHPHQRQSLQRYQDADDYTGDDDYKRRIQTLSCGLADVVTSSDTQVVQFIHQSVKDYFIDKGISTLGQSSKPEAPKADMEGHAHYQLSGTCIRYLAMEEIGQSISRERDYMTSEFPFLHYAATSWVAHTKQSETRNVPQDDILDYFGWPSEELVKRWVRIYQKLDRFSDECPPEGTNMIHLVSRYHLMEPLRVILRRANQAGTDIDVRDGSGRTPLSWAAEEGHEDVARLLLGTDKADVDAKDNGRGWALLTWAARNLRNAFAKLTIVKWLLATGQVDVDAKDNNGRTPLSWAARHGHEAIVKLLLATGKVDVDAKDTEYGRTPLSWAAENGHEAIV